MPNFQLQLLRIYEVIQLKSAFLQVLIALLVFYFWNFTGMYQLQFLHKISGNGPLTSCGHKEIDFICWGLFFIAHSITPCLNRHPPSLDYKTLQQNVPPLSHSRNVTSDYCFFGCEVRKPSHQREQTAELQEEWLFGWLQKGISLLHHSSLLCYLYFQCLFKYVSLKHCSLKN